MITKTFYSCGLGNMGIGVAKELQSRGWNLVGATSHQDGKDSGFVTTGEPNDVQIAMNLPEYPVKASMCVVTTRSTLAEVLPEISWALQNGMDVLCSAEELAYPDMENSAEARQIHKLAVRHGKSVLGTGVNPGFVMDVLPTILSVACTRVQSIEVERVNDLSPFGVRVLESFGIGLSREEFNAQKAHGNIAGHVGFHGSIMMISDALGLGVDRIESTAEPIIAQETRTFRDVVIEPGQVAGSAESAIGYANETAVIKLSHPQQVLPRHGGVSTRDRIVIMGEPNIEMQISPEIPGGIGTIALLINSAEKLIAAKPGLLTMLDLGLPTLTSRSSSRQEQTA